MVGRVSFFFGDQTGTSQDALPLKKNSNSTAPRRSAGRRSSVSAVDFSLVPPPLRSNPASRSPNASEGIAPGPSCGGLVVVVSAVVSSSRAAAAANGASASSPSSSFPAPPASSSTFVASSAAPAAAACAAASSSRLRRRPG